MNKVIGIAIFCLASFLLSMNTAHAQEGRKVKLGWEKKYTSRYSDDTPVAVKFLSAQINSGKLIFDILLQ